MQITNYLYQKHYKKKHNIKYLDGIYFSKYIYTYLVSFLFLLKI